MIDISQDQAENLVREGVSHFYCRDGSTIVIQAHRLEMPSNVIQAQFTDKDTLATFVEGITTAIFK